MVKLLPLFKKERECGTCTKCCEGWNVFNIQGKSIKPGKPCSFVEEGKGCTIYKDRPAYPCKAYNCEWKARLDIPEKFKPEVCGVIINRMNIHGLDFFLFNPAPNDPTEEMIEWAKKYFKDMNFVHYDKDKISAYGSKDFTKLIESGQFGLVSRFYEDVIKIRKNLKN